jgi:hypothetical protein
MRFLVVTEESRTLVTRYWDLDNWGHGDITHESFFGRSNVVSRCTVRRECIIEHCRARRLGGTTANPEHLAKLKEGFEVWNQWRLEHPDARPDFRTADLNGADLRGASLHMVNFNEATLHKATLYKADLRGATWSAVYITAISEWQPNLLLHQTNAK